MRQRFPCEAIFRDISFDIQNKHHVNGLWGDVACECHDGQRQNEADCASFTHYQMKKSFVPEACIKDLDE